MIKLAPSILSANFNKLGEEINDIKKAGANYCHFDVMDGSFVPNIALGIPELACIRKNTDIILDVHLMIVNPENHIEAFAKAGADIINFHYEATKNAGKTIEKIKSFGKKAGLTIKPSTDVENIYKYLEDLDLVLIMSVEPGFGGQKFIANSLEKARKISQYIKGNSLKTEIQMDGGINHDNCVDILKSGVNVIVAGSSVYNDYSDTCENVKKFYKIFEEYQKC